MKGIEQTENSHTHLKAANTLQHESRHRISQYCHTVDSLVGNHKLIFNSFTGSLLELSPQEHQLVEPVLDGHTTDTGDNKLNQRLLDAGVIVPQDLDELAVIRERRDLRHLEKNFLGLTIAPTLQCNFRCDYCFEAHPNERMNADTEEALYKFIEEKSKNAKGISVTWYGGEPLLALKTLVRIQKYINEFGEKRGLTINREMITNGFLLNPKAVSELNALGD